MRLAWNANAPAAPIHRRPRPGLPVRLEPDADRSGQRRTRPKDIQAQTRQVLNPLRAVLQTAGSSLENAVKTTPVIAEMDALGTINAIDAASFAGQPPARACAQVGRLPKDVQIQIEAVALTS